MRYLCLIVLVGLMVAGCSQRYPQSRTPATGPHKMSKIPVAETPRQFVEPILSLDENTVKIIYYVDHRQQRLSSGQLRISFNLFNISEEREAWVEWKAIFYDQSNFELENSDWRLLHIPRREVVTMKVNSMTPRAENYSILLRTPDRMD